VYTATNSPAGNTVLLFHRAADGTLSPGPSYPTGGTGTGAGLGNQGGVTLSSTARWLFVVNAGSNSVSVFFRRPDGTLERTDHEPSGGVMPISVTHTTRGNRVYVLNAGGDGNISGFTLTFQGQLVPIPGSTQPLSQAGGTGPAQISFSNTGLELVVTEKMTNRIDVYTVDAATGVASGPTVHPSAGMTPFGFAFDGKQRVIVSEAQGGVPNASTVSSYRLSGSALSVISPTVPDFQTAACWIVITNLGKYAYTTNTGSNNISGYAIQNSGAITLLTPGGVTATSDAGPIDAALSHGDQQFLYVLNSMAGTITTYVVDAATGALTQFPGGVGGLPPGTNGLAAW
jgi:6-phosphogluconolactonase (cycloisomerase 2 family)